MSNLVSVVVPTYGRLKLLDEALDTIATQAYPAWECIVVDDGSTDGTAEAVRRRAERDPRFRAVLLDHSGLPGRVRNAGLREARGNLVAFLDDDDLWTPEKLDVQLPLFEDPSVVLTCGRVEEFGARSGEWPQERVPSRPDFELLTRGNLVATSTVVARTETLREIGGFDERLPRAQDYDLWLRVARRGGVLFLNAVLARYRVHADNISADRVKTLECLEIVLQKLAQRGDISSQRLHERLRANYRERAGLAPSSLERTFWRFRALF